MLCVRLRKRLGERFGEISCKGLGEMLEPNMLQHTSGKLGERFVKMLGLVDNWLEVLCKCL